MSGDVADSEIRCKGRDKKTKNGADHWHHSSAEKCYTREDFRRLDDTFCFHFLNSFFDGVRFDGGVGASHLANDGRGGDDSTLVAAGTARFVTEYEAVEAVVEIECPCAIEHSHAVRPEACVDQSRDGIVIGFHLCIRFGES